MTDLRHVRNHRYWPGKAAGRINLEAQIKDARKRLALDGTETIVHKHGAREHCTGDATDEDHLLIA